MLTTIGEPLFRSATNPVRPLEIVEFLFSTTTQPLQLISSVFLSFFFLVVATTI